MREWLKILGILGLGVVALILWNLRPVDRNPGQEIDPKDIAYPPLPRIEYVLDFSVAVARFERDSEGAFEEAVVESLWTLSPLERVEQEFEVVRLLRPVSVSRLEDLETATRGLETAREYVKITGADVLIWGSFEPLDGAMQVVLHWIDGSEKAGDDLETCPGIEGHTIGFADPNVALEVLTALIELRGAEYAQDHFRLVPPVERLRDLPSVFQRALRAEMTETYSEETRVQLYLLYGDAERMLVNLGIGNPEAAFKAYSAVKIDAGAGEIGPIQRAHLLQNRGEMAFRSSRISRAPELQDQSIAILKRSIGAREEGCDRRGAVEAKYLLGLVLYDSGRRKRSAKKLKESIHVLGEARDFRAAAGEGVALDENQLMLGLALLALAELEPSKQNLELALREFERSLSRINKWDVRKMDVWNVLAIVRDQPEDTVVRWAIAQNGRGRALVLHGELLAAPAEVCNGLVSSLAAWEAFQILKSSQAMAAALNVDLALQVLDGDTFSEGARETCLQKHEKQVNKLRHAIRE